MHDALGTFWPGSLTVANDRVEDLKDLGAVFTISSALRAERRILKQIWCRS